MSAESMSEPLCEVIERTLDAAKAVDSRFLDVREQTSVTDVMVVTTGTSPRHVRAIADHVIKAARAVGRRPLGVEGEAQSEWVLVDLGDAVIHVMLPPVRDYYQLEKLWSLPAAPLSGV